MRELSLVFQILLLVAMVAGIFTWNRRSGPERRDAGRGGRRDSDAAPHAMGEEPASH